MAGWNRRCSHASRTVSATPVTSSARQGRSARLSSVASVSGVPAMMFNAPLASSQPVDARKPAMTGNGMKRTSRANPKRSIRM